MCLGAWAMDPTLPKGQSRIQISLASTEATSYFDFEELAGPFSLNNQPAEYTQDHYQLEYTYGYTNDIAFVVRTRQKDRALTSASEEVRHDGLAGYALSVRQAIGIGQASRFYNETGVILSEEDEAPLPLSPGGTSWFTMVSYNQDFLPSKAGFSMDVGYVFGGDAEDEVHFNTELVLDFLRIVDISLEYSVLESRKDRKEEFSPLDWPETRGYQEAAFWLHRDLGRSFRASLGYHNRFKGRNTFETDGYLFRFSWWFDTGRR